MAGWTGHCYRTEYTDLKPSGRFSSCPSQSWPVQKDNKTGHSRSRLGPLSNVFEKTEHPRRGDGRAVKITDVMSSPLKDRFLPESLPGLRSRLKSRRNLDFFVTQFRIGCGVGGTLSCRMGCGVGGTLSFAAERGEICEGTWCCIVFLGSLSIHWKWIDFLHIN